MLSPAPKNHSGTNTSVDVASPEVPGAKLHTGSEARLDPAFEQEDLVLGKIYEERSAEAPLQRRVQPHAAEAQQEGLAIRGG